jgi:adenylate kinase
MRIAILGPPGSGKSTRAKTIGELYHLPVITSSELLKDSIRENTDHGKLIQTFMDRGELVPDEIVNQVVKDRLQKPDTENGFVLDGYPRNIAQAEALSSFLKKEGKELDYAVQVEVDIKKLVNRLSKRRVCPNCGATYHLKYNPPAKDNICDRCGFKLIQRDDDKPEIIRRRLKDYQKRVQPLLDNYNAEGKLKHISGDIALEKLHQILNELFDYKRQ